MRLVISLTHATIWLNGSYVCPWNDKNIPCDSMLACACCSGFTEARDEHPELEKIYRTLEQIRTRHPENEQYIKIFSGIILVELKGSAYCPFKFLEKERCFFSPDSFNQDNLETCDCSHPCSRKFKDGGNCKNFPDIKKTNTPTMGQFYKFFINKKCAMIRLR